MFAGWSAFAQPLSFESDSKIWVEGTSSVQAWTCEVGQFTGSVTGEIANGVLTDVTTTTLSIPVSRMDCGGRQITSKMRDALKSSNHPNIQFALSSANVAAPNSGRFGIDTRGRVTIAGVTRDVRLVSEGHVLADGRYRLKGSVPLVMSDFGVDPPTAMLGALRTGDAVTIQFDVIVAR